MEWMKFFGHLLVTFINWNRYLCYLIFHYYQKIMHTYHNILKTHHFFLRHHYPLGWWGRIKHCRWPSLIPRITLGCSADNPASYDLGGFKNLTGALRKCRFCLTTQEDMSKKVLLLCSVQCNMRTCPIPAEYMVLAVSFACLHTYVFPHTHLQCIYMLGMHAGMKTNAIFW